MIYSFNDISTQIALMLKQRGYEVVIVEDDESKESKIKEAGFTSIITSLMEDENLEKLSLDDKSLKAFFVLSENKNNNLFKTMLFMKICD